MSSHDQRRRSAADPAELDKEVREAFAALARDYPALAKRLFGNDPELGVDRGDDDPSIG